MNRTSISIGVTFALMAIFFAGVNSFDGNRLAQVAVAAIYAVSVFLVASWANRRVA